MNIIHYNEKVGCKTLNTSPEVTCVGKPCYRKCYASLISAKSGKRFPRYSVIAKSREKTHIALLLPETADTVAETLRGESYFRWFSEGDIVDEAIPAIDKAARLNPKTMMHLPTADIGRGLKLYKKYKNLQVIFSTWPEADKEYNKERAKYRHSIVVPAKTETAPKGYFLCPGKCASCRVCYKNNNINIAFPYHGTRYKMPWEKCGNYWESF